MSFHSNGPLSPFPCRYSLVDSALGPRVAWEPDEAVRSCLRIGDVRLGLRVWPNCLLFFPTHGTKKNKAQTCTESQDTFPRRKRTLLFWEDVG